MLLLLQLFLACLHGLDVPAFVSLHLVLPRQEGVEAVARIARPRPRPPKSPLRRIENCLHRVRGWRNRSHIGQITI